MKHGNARRLSVVVIAILTAALALSASAGARLAAGPKADHIAYMSMKDGQADIYTMDAAGFAQVNLTHDQTIGWRADSEPAWSPNGQWVAFQRAYTKAQELGTRLFVVSSYGKEMHALTPTTNLAVIDQHPAWSPDGSTIVFSSNRSRTLRAVHGQGDGHRPRTADIHERRDREPRAGLVAGRAVDRLRPPPVEQAAPRSHRSPRTRSTRSPSRAAWFIG